MHITVIGAGLIGIASAYFLRKAGFEVTVIDANSACALEASHLNGGQLSYTHAEPWGNWGNIKKGLKWICMKDAPLLLRPQKDLESYKWLLKFVFSAFPKNYIDNMRSILMLNYYSKNAMDELMQAGELDFNFHFRPSGIMHVYRTANDLDEDLKVFEILQSMNDDVSYQYMNANDVVNFDPALERLMSKRNGAIFCKNDAVADAYLFVQNIEKKCADLGVKFLYNSKVTGVVCEGGVVKGLELNKLGSIDSDMCVVCAGAYSKELLKKVDIKLDIYPMKGYTVDVAVKNADYLPHVSVTDHYRKTVFSDINNRMRISGTAEFAGFNKDVLDERIDPMLNLAREYFGDSIDMSDCVKWSCLRPQMPQSRPVITKSNIENVYINTGNGSLGWTQCLGSAKYLSELILGKKSNLIQDDYNF